MKTIVLAISLSAAASAAADELTLRVENIRSSKGVILCDLYKSAAGFPDDPAKAVMRKEAAISPDGKAECAFDALGSGEVAVAVLHDEDRDGKMKTNFVGIPQEGWAVTNNAKAQTFGPPRFADAKLQAGKVKTQTLRMKY